MKRQISLEIRAHVRGNMLHVIKGSRGKQRIKTSDVCIADRRNKRTSPHSSL